MFWRLTQTSGIKSLLIGRSACVLAHCSNQTAVTPLLCASAGKTDGETRVCLALFTPEIHDVAPTREPAPACTCLPGSGTGVVPLCPQGGRADSAETPSVSSEGESCWPDNLHEMKLGFVLQLFMPTHQFTGPSDKNTANRANFILVIYGVFSLDQSKHTHTPP